MVQNTKATATCQTPPQHEEKRRACVQKRRVKKPQVFMGYNEKNHYMPFERLRRDRGRGRCFFIYIFSTSGEENACSDLQNLVDSK